MTPSTPCCRHPFALVALVIAWLVVPPDAPPGLYSIVAIRGFELATLSGGIEVTS